MTACGDDDNKMITIMIMIILTKSHQMSNAVYIKLLIVLVKLYFVSFRPPPRTNQSRLSRITDMVQDDLCLKIILSVDFFKCYRLQKAYFC